MRRSLLGIVITVSLSLSTTRSMGVYGQGNPDPRWGRIANPDFINQHVRTTLFFAGQAKDGTTNPYGCPAVPPSNMHFYTVNPTDSRHLEWSAAEANQDLPLQQMADLGLNVVSMSSWGESFLTCKNSWRPYAPMQTAPGSHDELFAAADRNSLLITPFIETRGNWSLRGGLAEAGSAGTVSQINNLVRRYLKNPQHPEWADQWTQVYDRDGQARYAVSLIHASSNLLEPNEHTHFADGFDSIVQQVHDETGVEVGLFLDVLPRNSPYAPGTFRPTPTETGPELAQRSSILGIQAFIPEIWADVSDQKARVAWKRNFSEDWAATGIPFLMDVSPGYDAHLVFPNSVQYGHNVKWLQELTGMVEDFGHDGLVFNSWNGYTEAMAAVETDEHGTAYSDWLRDLIDLRSPRPEDMITDLIAVTDFLEIRGGTSNALKKKLSNACASITADNADARNNTTGMLQAFIHSVEAQSGKRIGVDDASYLVLSTEDIIHRIQTLNIQRRSITAVPEPQSLTLLVFGVLVSFRGYMKHLR